ncbi:MAG: hypothetical protein IT209_10395 [Armatimonadetes bacterium]|nr:hypothetical protein [Armatimonadota bacterium]
MTLPVTRWRLILSLALCVAIAGSSRMPVDADSGCEPALTARLAEITLLKLPPDVRAQIAPLELDLRARLQTLPLFKSDDLRSQLQLIFKQSKDNVASADLLAAAARSVVALAFEKLQNEENGAGFLNAVALQTQLSDAPQLTTQPVTDPTAAAESLSSKSAKLRSDVLSATKTGDSASLAALRKGCVGWVAQSLADAWAGMLSIQAHPQVSKTVTDDPEGDTNNKTVLQTGAPPSSAQAPSGSGPSSGGKAMYIGNKQSKKFHKPGCRMGPGPSNSVPLYSRQEAIDGKYTPCRVCKP